jgi:hypothetical protein
MRNLSRAGIAAGITAAVMATFLAAPAMAGAVRDEVVADDLPPFAVETFEYPQSEEILEEQGLLLKRGDGHIVLAECESEENLLTLLARGRDDVCFRTTGATGFLSLEVDSVYGVRTNDSDNTHLEMTAEGDEVEYDIPADTWEGVGEAVDGREHVLVEIRVTQ